MKRNLLKKPAQPHGARCKGNWTGVHPHCKMKLKGTDHDIANFQSHLDLKVTKKRNQKAVNKIRKQKAIAIAGNIRSRVQGLASKAPFPGAAPLFGSKK